MNAPPPPPPPPTDTTTRAQSQSQASVFRLLTWNATIPVEIRLARDSLPQETTQQRGGDDGEHEEEEDGLPRDEQPVADSSCWLRGRHWSLDMIQLWTIINSHPVSSSRHQHHQHEPTQHRGTPSSTGSPLRLILHLKPRQPQPASIPPPAAPPPPPATPLSNSIETCRIAFISLLKEADYIRWGNTRRITGLRRADLEGAWEGVVDHNYETHARFTSKIVPLPLPAPPVPVAQQAGKGKGDSSSSSATTPTPTPTPAKTTTTTPPHPAENLGTALPAESCYAVRSIPLKLYLPDNAPEVQDIVNPLNANGEPTTLISFLRQALPLLFPVPAPDRDTDTDDPTRDPAYALATPVLYGVVVPPEAAVAWLAACVCAPDGWLRIGVVLA
ncbi:hypothetical protein QFC21_006867 [Naganishia friedmannii]|uniref:Uncharacterized protein n=1 Tax=Naganishia friedmannii TaxID=89922 RepID=A0ACC2UZ55_9TREE|nr:hypothetical protein QFC21_006867 [Naganishia friedmannii]